MSLIAAIADSVVTTINALAVPPHAIAAQRRAVPTLELEVTEALQIPVITPQIDRERQNRSTFQNTLTIDVGVLQLVNGTPAGVDPMLDLVEAILNAAYPNVTDAGRAATFVAATTVPLYDADALETASAFVSVIRLTYVEFQK